MRLGLFERVRRFARLRSRIRWRPGRPPGPSGRTGPAGYPGNAGSSNVSGYPGGSTSGNGPEPGTGPVARDAAAGGPRSAGPRSAGTDSRGSYSTGAGPTGAGPTGPGSTGPGSGDTGSGGPVSAGAADEVWPRTSGAGRHRRDGDTGAGPARAVRSGSARARVREAPPPAREADPAEGPARQQGKALPVPEQAQASTARPGTGRADTRASARAAARARTSAQSRVGPVRGAVRSAHTSMRARLPFVAPQAQEEAAAADGRRHCGTLERVIWRQWDVAAMPPPEVVWAIDRLAELPERIKERLADGLDSIFVGPGGVPELDDMTSLRGVRLPSGHASWDICAGAYGERKIVVGSRPSPTPDVMCHEIGHALDDIDSPSGTWQSDSAEFRMLYDQCQPHFASDFHRQPGGLGRKEFFADAFAAIASRQRPALVDMLSGDTRTALRVMLYFNRRYGI